MSMSAAIPLECPGCQCSLKVPENLAGKKIRCPKCKSPVAVPANGSAPTEVGKSPAKAPAKAPTVKVNCPDCGNPLRLPADFPVGKQAKCPVCDRIFEPLGKAPPPRTVPPVAGGTGPKPAAASIVPTAESNGSLPETSPVADGDGQVPAAGDEFPAPPPVMASRSSAFSDGIGPLAGLLLVPVALLVLVGWGIYAVFLSGPSGPSMRRVYAAAGSVVHDGKPAVGAVVTLIPEVSTDHVHPTGTTGEDGRFTLTTYNKDDGAPTGRYKVGILWAGPNGTPLILGPDAMPRKPKDSPELEAIKDPKGIMTPWEARQEAAKSKKGPRGLKKGQPAEPELDLERYANPETSGLTVEIKSSSNTLTPFELK